MTKITLDEIITSLTILRQQFKDRGTDLCDGVDELIFTAGEIRLKRGTKTLKIPVEMRSTLKP